MRFVTVNGEDSAVCSVLDRGLQFGDGLFETMLCVGGAPVDFPEHWARLDEGCRRLGIECPDIRREVTAAIARWGAPRAVAKLVVTRGSTERGYRCAPSVRPNWILTITDAPKYPLAHEDRGVAVKLCRTLVSLDDPQLAGLKHLNRLPQVLARREWDDEYHDGLLTDHGGHLVEGCTSNLFLVADGALRTPDLTACGVRGIVRQKVLDHSKAIGIRCEVTTLKLRDLEHADEVFLTNSVYGIVPVGSVDGMRYRIGPTTARLLKDLCQGVYF
ncbi:aminodeoxychorismate lyase [Cystobacter ferrugineus]|uniref:aminodeoxychorismate lyase n=2 Tax=Cystobacter TaxID=42 RepID=A0A1L9AXV8_9BACT|nr:aminodeoxychorismate lyase [Cystobacter ferrugineus]AKP45397.1 aminodeoxychorismate lyase [Cystobacter sp. Cbv34]OJH34837.1 aminodeoxychorismate lyase [Cystobacter ferrugineus]QQZ45544.1 CysI [synthetic construct]